MRGTGEKPKTPSPDNYNPLFRDPEEKETASKGSQEAESTKLALIIPEKKPTGSIRQKTQSLTPRGQRTTRDPEIVNPRPLRRENPQGGLTKIDPRTLDANLGSSGLQPKSRKTAYEEEKKPTHQILKTFIPKRKPQIRLELVEVHRAETVEEVFTDTKPRRSGEQGTFLTRPNLRDTSQMDLSESLASIAEEKQTPSPKSPTKLSAIGADAAEVVQDRPFIFSPKSPRAPKFLLGSKGIEFSKLASSWEQKNIKGTDPHAALDKFPPSSQDNPAVDEKIPTTEPRPVDDASKERDQDVEEISTKLAERLVLQADADFIAGEKPEWRTQTSIEEGIFPETEEAPAPSETTAKDPRERQQRVKTEAGNKKLLRSVAGSYYPGAGVMAPKTSRPLAEAIDTLIRKNPSTVMPQLRVLKMFRCAAGATIDSDPQLPETGDCAAKLSNLLQNQRHEYLQALFDRLKFHLTPIQREIVGNFLEELEHQNLDAMSANRILTSLDFYIEAEIAKINT